MRVAVIAVNITSYIIQLDIDITNSIAIPLSRGDTGGFPGILGG